MRQESSHVLQRVPGVVETLLTDALLAGLPTGPPPAAPWTCTASAVVWLGRGGRAAVPALAPALRPGARPLAVVGGLVRYLDTPVGAYDEVLGTVAYLRGPRPRATVSLMAVDLPESLVGGRGNWSMPKTLAAFDGAPTGGTMTATGPDWSVGATIRTFGPAIPVATVGSIEQEWPDGVVRTCRIRARGRLRPALVTTAVRSSGPLATWLRPGRHVGAVAERLTFTLGVAEE